MCNSSVCGSVECSGSQAHGLIIVIDNVPLDDDITDDILMSSQLVDQMFPPAVIHRKNSRPRKSTEELD